jgi:hypothetical protein
MPNMMFVEPAKRMANAVERLKHEWLCVLSRGALCAHNPGALQVFIQRELALNGQQESRTMHHGSSNKWKLPNAS